MPGSTTVATAALIDQAERELGVVFPVELRAVWLTHNCTELPVGGDFSRSLIPATRRRRLDRSRMKTCAVRGESTFDHLILWRSRRMEPATIW